MEVAVYYITIRIWNERLRHVLESILSDKNNFLSDNNALQASIKNAEYPIGYSALILCRKEFFILQLPELTRIHRF